MTWLQFFFLTWALVLALLVGMRLGQDPAALPRAEDMPGPDPDAHVTEGPPELRAAFFLVAVGVPHVLAQAAASLLGKLARREVEGGILLSLEEAEKVAFSHAFHAVLRLLYSSVTGRLAGAS
jgi:hypothetical protein